MKSRVTINQNYLISPTFYTTKDKLTLSLFSSVKIKSLAMSIRFHDWANFNCVWYSCFFDLRNAFRMATSTSAFPFIGRQMLIRWAYSGSRILWIDFRIFSFLSLSFFGYSWLIRFKSSFLSSWSRLLKKDKNCIE